MDMPKSYVDLEGLGMKKIIIIGVIILAAFIGYHFFSASMKAPHAGGMPSAMPVSVAVVERKDVIETSEFSGRFHAVADADIHPQVTGTIQKVLFNEGDMVKAGQPLFIIDQRDFKAALVQASAANEQAQASLERGQTLYKADAISKHELETRTAAAAQALAALTTARLNLEYSTVKAPISGRVGRADITIGNVVNAGGQAPTLTTIQSIDPIYVDFDMDEQTYLTTRTRQQANSGDNTGTPVAIALANSDSSYTIIGTLKAVDNQLDPATGSLRARAVVANHDGSLLPGLFARVRVGAPTPVNAVVINDAAIATDQDKRNVFVVGSDNKAHYREVQTGPLVNVDGNQMRVITGGLNGGEHIVVNGLMRVHPEGAVVPQIVDMNTLSPTTPMGKAAAPASQTTVSGTEK